MCLCMNIYNIYLHVYIRTKYKIRVTVCVSNKLRRRFILLRNVGFVCARTCVWVRALLELHGNDVSRTGLNRPGKVLQGWDPAPELLNKECRRLSHWSFILGLCEWEVHTTWWKKPTSSIFSISISLSLNFFLSVSLFLRTKWSHWMLFEIYISALHWCKPRA